MKTKIIEQYGVAVITIDGNIPQESVAGFRNRITDLIEHGKLHIVLDLSASSYISSLCLAVIVDAKNRLGSLHGDIKIAVANRLIRNLLEITNLSKKIEVFETIDEAVKAFA